MSNSNLFKAQCLQCNCKFEDVVLYQQHVEECHSNEVPAKTATDHSFHAEDEPKFGSHVKKPAASTNVPKCVEIYSEDCEGASSPIHDSVPRFGFVTRKSPSHSDVSSGSQKQPTVVATAKGWLKKSLLKKNATTINSTTANPTDTNTSPGVEQSTTETSDIQNPTDNTLNHMIPKVTSASSADSEPTKPHHMTIVVKNSKRKVNSLPSSNVTTSMPLSQKPLTPATNTDRLLATVAQPVINSSATSHQVQPLQQSSSSFAKPLPVAIAQTPTSLGSVVSGKAPPDGAKGKKSKWLGNPTPLSGGNISSQPLTYVISAPQIPNVNQVTNVNTTSFPGIVVQPPLLANASVPLSYHPATQTLIGSSLSSVSTDLNAKTPAACVSTTALPSNMCPQVQLQPMQPGIQLLTVTSNPLLNCNINSQNQAYFVVPQMQNVIQLTASPPTRKPKLPVGTTENNLLPSKDGQTEEGGGDEDEEMSTSQSDASIRRSQRKRKPKKYTIEETNKIKVKSKQTKTNALGNKIKVKPNQTKTNPMKGKPTQADHVQEKGSSILMHGIDTIPKYFENHLTAIHGKDQQQRSNQGSNPPFSCEICKKTFFSENDLKSHMPSCRRKSEKEDAAKKGESGQKVKAGLLQNANAKKRKEKKTVNNFPGTKDLLSKKVKPQDKKQTTECKYCRKKMPINSLRRHELRSHRFLVSKEKKEQHSRVLQKSQYDGQIIHGQSLSKHQRDQAGCGLLTMAKESDQETMPQEPDGVINFCDLSEGQELLQETQDHTSHNTQPSVKCDFCEKVFSSISNLRKHIVVHGSSGVPNCECTVCHKVLPSSSSLKRHILERHPLSDLSIKVQEGDFVIPRRFPCKPCGALFQNSSDLQSHILERHLQVSEKRMTECKYCRKKMPINSLRRHELRSHRFLVSKEKKEQHSRVLQKSQYDGQIIHGQSLSKHQRDRAGCGLLVSKEVQEKRSAAMRECQYCGLIMHKTSIARHINRKHTGYKEPESKEEQERRIAAMRECQYCGLIMHRSSIAKHIIRLHTDYKERVSKGIQEKQSTDMATCQYCGKVMNRSSLSRHQREHTGYKVLCHICGMEFGQGSQLTSHMFVHKDALPFVCEVCGKIKKSKDALRKHQIVHSERPFRCQYCGKGIMTPYHLRLHEQRHRGELPFSCPHCPISFKTKYSLKKHLAKGQHQPNLSEREEQEDVEGNNEATEGITKTAGKSQTQHKSLEKSKQNRRGNKLKRIDEDSMESEESIDSECFDSQDGESFEDTESEDSDCIDYADDSDDYLEDEENTDTDEEWIPTKQRKVQTGRLDREIATPTDHMSTGSDESDLNEASSNTDDHDSETTSSNIVGYGVQSTKDIVTIKQEPELESPEAFEIPFITIKPLSRNEGPLDDPDP